MMALDTSLARGGGLDAIRASGSAAAAACSGGSGATRSPPRVAFCFAGAARTFATPLMLESHLHLLVRPLVVDEGPPHAAFCYLKLSDSPKRARVHFEAQTTELRSVLAALDGTNARHAWLNRILGEAVVINGSGSFDGIGWRPALDSRGGVGVGGGGGAGRAISSLRQPDASRAAMLDVRPNASICGGGGTHSTTEVALALRWCAAAIGRHEARTGVRYAALFKGRPDVGFSTGGAAHR